MKIHYHPDHLGSASFVTNAEGAVCQHIQYFPFGELFVSQRNCEFDSRYKFTAKELDNETSYTYFGARYYDSDLSVWLSVDPMSDKYPSLSPYIYSADNPVVLIDPNGEKVYIVGDAADEATGYLSTENIKVKRNSKTGELSVKGKAKNENEKLLVEAIKSSEVIVELTANNSNVIGINEDGTREISEHGGSFLGNEVFFNECGEAIGAIAKQYVSMDKLKELFAQDKIGASIYHEITEAFQGGLCSIELGESAKKATTGVDNPKYDLAHNLATPQPLFEKDVIHQTYKNQSKSVFEQFLEFSTQPNNKFNRKSSF